MNRSPTWIGLMVLGFALHAPTLVVTSNGETAPLTKNSRVSASKASPPETDAGQQDPVDFPRPPGLVRNSYSQTTGAYPSEEIATYHSKAGFDETVAPYLKDLQAAGWNKVSDSDSGSGLNRLRMIEWHLPAKEAEIRFYGGKDGSSDLRVRIFTYKARPANNPAKSGPGSAKEADTTALKTAPAVKVDPAKTAAFSKSTGAAPLGPPPTNLKVESWNPYSHNLTWAATSWTGFDLFRLDSNGRTPVSVNIKAIGSIDHAFLEPNTVYRLVVHHADGSEGSLDYTYANPPQPAVVTNLKAIQTGPGKVKLTWDRAQPASVVAETYQVTSPTHAVADTRVGTNSLELSGVSVGNHWVRVAMVYGDSSKMAPAPKEVSVNFDVLTDRNRYRITILGLECVHETSDDPLQLDGKRDEIYLGVYLATVPRQNSNAKPTPLGILRTKVMGDTNGYPDRIRAGTASDKGGIQTGDFVPDATITTTKPGVTGTTDRFPLKVWEDELTDASDLLVVAPVLFEWDSQNDLTWNRWVGWWSTPNGSVQLGETARQADPKYLGAALALEYQAEANSQGYHYPKHFGPGFAENTNRPLGLINQAYVENRIALPDYVWPPAGLVLNRSKIEKLLGSANSIVVSRGCSNDSINDPGNAGDYTLYIQIERLPGPSAPAATPAAGTPPAPVAPKADLPTANPAMVNNTRIADISKQSGAAPVGPPPANLSVFSNGPVAHEVSWTADQWTAFDVYRIDSKGRTPIAANLNATKVTDHVYLEAHTKYRVDVHHTDGSVGSAEYDYATPPNPAAPTGFRASQTGVAGQVKLSWVIIQYISGYQLYGPTLPPEGKFISSGYTTEVTDVPLGTQEFRLAAVYSGDGKLYPAPAQAKTGIEVHRVSDRYRVTLLGLQCVHETSDDLFQLDGKRDEVFAGAYVAALPDNSPLVPIVTVRTKIMGDTNGFPSRLQAGTASNKGGIQTGDYVPDATITTPKPGTAGTSDRFPLLLWEGVLSDTGGLIIVAPIVFEWDKPDETPWDNFVGWWSTPRAKTDVPAQAHINWIDKRWDHPLSSTWSRPINAYDNYQVNYGVEYSESGANRVIGVEDQANIRGNGYFVPTPVYIPKGLCLSHAKVEAALGAQSAILIMWRAQDEPHVGHAKLDGVYLLYIQIERLAPPATKPAIRR